MVLFFMPNRNKPQAELADVVLIYVEVMDFVSTNAEELLPAKKLAGEYRNAWKELRADLAHGPIALHHCTVSPKVPRSLKEHGLHEGQAQLTFKLQALYRAYRNWKQACQSWKVTPTSLLYDKMKEWLKRLLGILNVILKSLIKALPGGSAATEIKDIVEKLLDDVDAHVEGKELTPQERSELQRALGVTNAGGG